MANRKDLLSEAIADAKAVKETALANAKLALEEAFTPKLQSMISAKLAEEADEDEMDDEKLDDAAVAVEAEMDSEMDADTEKVEEEEGEEEHKVKEEEGEEPTDTDETYEGEEEMASDDDMTSEDEEEEMVSDYDMKSEEEEDEDDELDLESVIAELEDEMNGTDETYEGEEEMASDDDMTSEEEAEMDSEEDEEEIDLDEVIKTLKEMEDDSEKEDETVDEIKEEEEDSTKDDELEEAYLTIESLQKTINEVNLLNAKLLYTNKLFRTFDLNEGQKVKVLENFDRTSSVREVKLVFSTLAENLNVAKKKRTVVKEGYASKATKSSAPKKEIISEGNELSARWKKLAGLK